METKRALTCNEHSNVLEHFYYGEYGLEATLIGCESDLRYPPKRDRLYTVGPEPKGRLAGREHIADVAVGVWEEDEGVD
jgi:hypothetical protein